MNTRILSILSAALGLACAGCVVAPPPPPPAAMYAPAAPPQTAQAPATCREFQQTITVGGTAQEAYGTTCLQPDGSWKVTTAPQSPPPSAQPPAPPEVAAVPAYPPYPYYAYPYPYYGYPPAVYGGVVVRGRWR